MKQASFLFSVVLILFVIPGALLISSCRSTPSTAASATSAGNSTIGHGYYPELNEFTVDITDDPISSGPRNGDPFTSPFQGAYLNREVVIDQRSEIEKTALIFQTAAAGRAYVLIPRGMADNVKLVPGETYQIKYDIIHGWPFGYRLVINQGSALALAGVAMGSLDSEWSLNGLIPIMSTLSRIMAENYVDGPEDAFWARKTNVEVTFKIGENIVNLHQGQSTLLGNFEITLLIARQIQHKPNVYDANQNNFSYVIYAK
jgi:hypothetical protein